MPPLMRRVPPWQGNTVLIGEEDAMNRILLPNRMLHLGPPV